MVKRAIISDLNDLLAITKCCAKHMIDKKIYQWNELYPSKEVLQNDIALQQLWKLEVDDKIIGLIVLTDIEDAEYKDIKWLTKNHQNLYIHRLAVHPEFQGKGYAQKLMSFAENYAKQHNFISIRLDTFSQNKRNQKFYKQQNYKQLGSIYFPKQSEYPFYCFEKIVNV